MCWGRGNIREVGVQGNWGETWETVLGWRIVEGGGKCGER